MIDWASPEQRARAELNAEQVEFMRTTAVEIKKRGKILLAQVFTRISSLILLWDRVAPVFQKIREERDFGHELYFLAQLYDHDWKPVHTI